MNSLSIILISMGIMLGSILLIKPVLGLWALIFSALLVGGTVEYFFTGAFQVQWSITLLALVPLVSTFLSFITKDPNETKQFPPAVLLIIIFLCFIALISTILNSHYTEAILAAKNFFPFFSLPFAFYYVVKSEKTVRRIMLFLFIVAFIQVPVALFQYFIYLTRTTFKGDLVTGTFGGSVASVGGPNDVLSIFLLIHIVLLFALAKQKIIRFFTAVLLSSLLVIPIFLTNAKIVVILFVISFLIFYHKDLVKSPLTAIGGLILMVIVTSSIFYVYYKQGSSYSSNADTMSEYIVGSTSYVFSSKKNQLTRFSAITYWFEEHSLFSNPITTLFGHGLGSVKRKGDRAVGYVQSQSKYKTKTLGITAMTTLLWELGLIGTLVYISIFVAAFFAVTKLLKKNEFSPLHKAFLMTVQVAVVIFAISIPYKLTIIATQAYAVYIYTTVGYIVFWQRHSLKSNEQNRIRV